MLAAGCSQKVPSGTGPATGAGLARSAYGDEAGNDEEGTAMALDLEHRTTEDDPAYRAAVKRAEELQGYYTHLLVYLVVNAGLFTINLLTRDGGGGWWFYWPLAGWGIGLVIHTLVTFTGVFSESWKARKAAELYAGRRSG
jgi:hypothetical protein